MWIRSQIFKGPYHFASTYQQHFLPNLASANLEKFHSHQQTWHCTRTSASLHSRCKSVEQETLKQLTSGHLKLVNCTSDTSAAEAYPIVGGTEEVTDDSEQNKQEGKDKDLTDDMFPRGKKRSLVDVPHAPYWKRSRSEERGPSASSAALHPRQYEAISQTIWKFYQERQQPQELYVLKMQLRDALYLVMKGVFPYCGLYVVGSSLNGFGSCASDMDLCLMLSHCEIDQKTEATEILHLLYRALRKCTFLRDLKLIRAKVPILKFSDAVSKVECDLNINNAVGIRNTHLLNSYSKMDSRICPLVMFTKNWAKTHRINDASMGTISSYSLVLMVIHYLQCGCTPPVIPSLQQKYPHKYSSALDIRQLTLSDKLPPFESPNKQSLGELFVGFLHYYALIFNFQATAISIRLGTTLSREAVRGQNPVRNNPNQWKCLCIEEPFDLSNTARSVYDPHTFQRILRVFRQSFARVRQSGNVASILYEPI